MRAEALPCQGLPGPDWYAPPTRTAANAAAKTRSKTFRHPRRQAPPSDIAERGRPHDRGGTQETETTIQTGLGPRRTRKPRIIPRAPENKPRQHTHTHGHMVLHVRPEFTGYLPGATSPPASAPALPALSLAALLGCGVGCCCWGGCCSCCCPLQRLLGLLLLARACSRWRARAHQRCCGCKKMSVLLGNHARPLKSLWASSAKISRLALCKCCERFWVRPVQASHVCSWSSTAKKDRPSGAKQSTRENTRKKRCRKTAKPNIPDTKKMRNPVRAPMGKPKRALISKPNTTHHQRSQLQCIH